MQKKTIKKQIETLLETRKQEISNLELNEKLEKENLNDLFQSYISYSKY